MKISIPNPCHENWNEMTPQEQGRFCSVCEKCIIDISSMNKNEILNLSKRGEVCVLIKKEKIELINNSTDSFIPRLYKYSSFFFFLGLGSFGFGQFNSEINYTVQKIEELSKKDTVITIKLQVHDNFNPLVNVKVYLNKRKNKYKTYTDENGFFELTIPSKYIYDEIYIDNIEGQIRNYKINQILNKQRIGDELLLGYLEFKP